MRPCVCLSVFRLQVFLLSKRLNVASQKTVPHKFAGNPGVLFSAKDLGELRIGSPTPMTPNIGGVTIFDQ